MDLKQLYEKYNYPGENKLYKLAQSNNVKATHKDIQAFLKKQHVVQVFKVEPVKKGYIVAFHPFQRVEMDLIDMTKFSLKNGGYGWIFILVDVFTRKMFTYMMKNKTEISI